MNTSSEIQAAPEEQRLIILDTETTGINPRDGHRIVEVGCVEMINRQLTGRTYHAYIKPLDQRGQVLQMDQEVINIHGLTNDFLDDKPVEIDAIWGEALRRGEAKGVEMPELKKLDQQLREAVG